MSWTVIRVLNLTAGGTHKNHYAFQRLKSWYCMVSNKYHIYQILY